MIRKCNSPVATVRAISKQKIEMEKIPRRSMLVHGRMQLVARWNWITSSPLGRKVSETRKYTRAHVNEYEILRTAITEEKCHANSQAWWSSVYWQAPWRRVLPPPDPHSDQSQFPLQLPPLPRDEHKFFLVWPTTCFLYWNYWHGLSRHCLQFSTIDGAIFIAKYKLLKLGGN